METLVRLRIALADEPGALARVAALIASRGGNITSVDVHIATGPAAVDDLVVAFPEGIDLTTLREAIGTDGAGTLLSLQEARRADPVVVALNSAADLLSRGVREHAALIRSVAEMASSPSVWIAPNEDAGHWEAGRMALERGVAVAAANDLPEEMSARLPGPAWLLALPSGDGQHVVFVGRLQTNPFTNTEISRIEALLGLYAAALRH
jgi:ACT domain